MKSFRSAIIILSLIGLVSLSPVFSLAQGGNSRPDRSAQPPSQSSGDKKGQQKQQPIDQGDEPIKLNADLVDIVFTVLDEKNRLAPNIKRDQVEVFENGVQQDVRFF